MFGFRCVGIGNGLRAYRRRGQAKKDRLWSNAAGAKEKFFRAVFFN
jgi:hypothetical protein